MQIDICMIFKPKTKLVIIWPTEQAQSNLNMQHHYLKNS